MDKIPTDEELADRFSYHAPTTEAHTRHRAINDETLRLAKILRDLVPAGRQQSLALTKLEEVRMWANSGIACNHDKLWSVHLNDQNGMKYDQDKTFGAENLRQAFNQVRVLVENDYGRNGEFIGVDEKAMRTTKIANSYKHIENSVAIVKMLEKKVAKFNTDFQKKCMDSRDYEALEMYVIELLLGE